MFYSELNESLVDFIKTQYIFFVATAPQQGRINLSPKGIDTFHILDSNNVSWLNLTGSGNETAAHLLENGRITLMFCSFDGKPNILRIYGKGKSLHPTDKRWPKELSNFPTLPGARQIIEIKIDSIQTSCGTGVPLYTYEGERSQLIEWAEKRGEIGVKSYWKKKNTTSKDGNPTGISL